MLPVDPRHRENQRDDEYTDFAELKANGMVRDKSGTVVSIDKPMNQWSPRQRDELYQEYCELVKSGATERVMTAWIEGQAARLRMSKERAVDIINEGNGEHPGHNMRWWRGVSV